MPVFRLSEQAIDVNRNSLILDTNVLVKAFYTGGEDEERAEARFFLDESEKQLLVPSAVIVETWGWLVGSRKDWRGGYDFLAWINTPGTAAVVVPQKGELEREYDLINRSKIDCVDAIIALLADEISNQCGLKPAIAVATYDARDFLPLIGQQGIRMSIFDMRSFSAYDFNG